jgi:hypothetical protein
MSYQINGHDCCPLVTVFDLALLARVTMAEIQVTGCLIERLFRHRAIALNSKIAM